MAKFFPTCAEAAQSISLAEDSHLPRRERVGLYLHLAACSFCRRYLRQIRFLRSALEAQRDEFGNLSRQNLSEPARQRITEALSNSA